MMAQPVAMALGAAMSGFLIQGTHGWFGLEGWRWMFLFEGLPAVFLGIVALFYLTDRPKNASWLSREEGQTLSRLVESAQPRSGQPRTSLWRQVFDLRVVLLSLAYFCLVNTINANATWIPTIVRSVMETYSLSSVGLVSAIPALCALVAMPLWVTSSDRTGERRWHIVAALALAALGWVVVVLGSEPIIRLLGLVFTTCGAFCAMSTFWTLPQAILSEEARPAGIGFISAVGLLGSAVSPAVIGVLRDLTGSFAAGLFYAAGLLVIAIALIVVVCRINGRGEHMVR
jgi:ACS family 4-hydroxyphenylacetate permease-like MFS transporter